MEYKTYTSINDNDTSYTEAELNQMFRESSIENFIKEYELSNDFLNLLDELFPMFQISGLGLPFVAGGFFRRMVTGESLDNFKGDIDLFFSSDEQKYEFIRILEMNYATNTTTGLKLTAILNNYYYEADTKTKKKFIYLKETKVIPYLQRSQTVQINLLDKYFYLQAVSSDFRVWKGQEKFRLIEYDFFHSMFMYDPNTRRITYHELAVEQARKKICDFNIRCRSVSPIRQFERCLKFTEEGYSFDKKSKRNYCIWAHKNINRLDASDKY